MTVKIIVPGILPAGKCRNCSCQFTFNPSDARLVLDQRDGNYYTIDCPTCRQQHIAVASSI
jgi:hypothetical protein